MPIRSRHFKRSMREQCMNAGLLISAKEYRGLKRLREVGSLHLSNLN